MAAAARRTTLIPVRGPYSPAAALAILNECPGGDLTIPTKQPEITGLTSTETLSRQAANMKANVDEASSFLKKLSNPDRLLVACALTDGERSVRELEDLLGIRQPGLSQQLAELREAGLIVGRKEGKQVFYRLADPRVEIFIDTMHRLFCRPDNQISTNKELTS